jgi:hypothetical protein
MYAALEPRSENALQELALDLEATWPLGVVCDDGDQVAAVLG